MSIKHFIITRFLCDNFNNCEDKELFDEIRLNDMLYKLQYHLVASLENQTNKNFELLIIIHNNIPITLINSIFQQLEININFRFIRKKEINDYIEYKTTNKDIIATTRIDGDDMVCSDFISITQNYIIKNHQGYGLIGLSDGATIMDGENSCYYWPKQSCARNKTGFHSMGITFYYPKNEIKKVINIYELGNHRFVCSTLNSNYSQYGFKKKPNIYYIPEDEKNVKSLYIGYNNNDSLKAKKKWHYTNNKLKINLLRRFNYSQKKLLKQGVVKTDDIISLTSYGERIKYLPKVLDSLILQKYQALKIFLVICEKDKEYINTINDYLEKTKEIIELHLVEEDLKSHKKYFYAMQEYKNNPIITVDDDVLYSPSLVMDLYKKHQQFPNAIIAGRTHKIKYDTKQNILEYKNWDMQVNESTPNYDLCSIGIDGVLYPPNIFDITDENLNDIYETITCDDLYLHYLSLINGIKTVSCTYTIPPTYIKENTIKATSLYYSVNKDSNNDKVIKYLWNKLNETSIELTFTDHKKPLCFINVLNTPNGIRIFNEMFSKLSERYDIIVFKHYGVKYEYPGLIEYFKQLHSYNEPILYIHTKGAGNLIPPSPEKYINENIAKPSEASIHNWQECVRNMWYDEFINHIEFYFDINENEVRCPFTGSTKATWNNAFVASPSIVKYVSVLETSNRYYYENLFRDNTNISVKGRIYNDIVYKETKTMYKMQSYIWSCYKES